MALSLSMTLDWEANTTVSFPMLRHTVMLLDWDTNTTVSFPMLRHSYVIGLGD